MITKKIICIYGPTASGKTSLAIKIARELNGVVINMDSKQTYYYLQNLTASPSLEEQQQVKHFFFNFLSPSWELTVGQWYRSVMDFISTTRFEAYIIVGGSGFYLKYLLSQGKHRISRGIYDNLVRTYIDYYKWEDICRIFFPEVLSSKVSPIPMRIPHKQDKFRTYNYLKFYLEWKFPSSNLLTFNENIKSPKNFSYEKEQVYSYLILLVDPSMKQLQENIIKRTPNLVTDTTIEEARWIMQHLYCSRNFHTIMGLKEMVRPGLNKQQMIESINNNTIKYAKQQKKWIKQFIGPSTIVISDVEVFDINWISFILLTQRKKIPKYLGY